MYRNGDPGGGDTAFKTVLRRTLKTATHETGHMFSMKHCTAHLCNMCGSNNREESDSHPLHLCPECLAKLWWATGIDLEKRFADLQGFFRRHGFEEEARFAAQSLERLSHNTTTY